MAPPLQLRFATSAPDLHRLPDSPAEVALVGRSNVGKSSLLNALAARKDLARTSKTPGRTRLLNCFELPGEGTVVDCPGYGWASASKADRAQWQSMVETYLVEREALVMTLVLVDGEVGPTDLDQAMLAGMRQRYVPHTVIATKHDKVRSKARERRKRDLAAGCELERSDVLWVSSAKGVNIDVLRGRVLDWLRHP